MGGASSKTSTTEVSLKDVALKEIGLDKKAVRRIVKSIVEPGAGCRIPKTEERGITLKQLGKVKQQVQSLNTIVAHHVFQAARYPKQGTGRIKVNFHSYALPGFIYQSTRKDLANVIIRKDITFKLHTMLRFPDRSQHRII